MEDNTIQWSVRVGFILLGVWMGYALASGTFRNEAIKQECAHYDPKTAEFKWGPLQ